MPPYAAAVRTTRGLERLVTFVDAIVAIAITLLILPVVDLVGTERGQHSTELFAVPLGQLAVFLLSFVVIARLWVAHHAIFEHVHRYDAALVFWTLAWAFTIVFLPFPTELAVGTPAKQLSVRALYIGTMALSSCCLAVLAVLISRRPLLRTPGRSGRTGHPGSPEDSETPESPGTLETPEAPAPFHSDVAIITAIMFVVAFAFAVAIRPLGYYALLLLVGDGAVVRLWRSLRRRHGGGTPPGASRRVEHAVGHLPDATAARSRR